jgi:uncharacterized protein with gpF-like domain
MKLAHKAPRNRISIRREYIEQNRLRIGFERKLRLQLQTLFAETGQKAQQDYRDAGRLINTQRDFSTNLKAILDAQYRAVIDEFGLRILRYQKQDSQFELIIREFINLYGATRVTQISGTTLAQIQRIIKAGELEGLGVSVIATNIFKSMRGSFSKFRSATIARTETHTAASYANHAINESLKIPNQMKRWVAVADERSRPWHQAMNGKEVPLDEDFIVRGMPMSYTGDPKGGASNVINCRCVTVYFTPEDEIED